MSDNLPTPAQTSQDAPAVQDPDAHLSALSRRQVGFVQSIVWDGLPFTHVFQKLGIPERTAYRWMRDPAVLAAIKAEERVLRSSARSGNILALKRVRDESENSLAVVQAVKALEQLADQDQGTAAPGQSRGYVIVINAPSSAGTAVDANAQPIGNARVIDVTPSGGECHDATDDTSEGGGGELADSAARTDPARKNRSPRKSSNSAHTTSPKQIRDFLSA